MPVFWWFNAEVRNGAGWTIPLELPPRHIDKGCPIGGEFGWLRETWASSKVFFAPDAIFPFAPGRPPDASEFCRLWDAHQPTWVADFHAHWIEYEELHVDLWDEPAVLMHSAVPAPLAGLFGDGKQALCEAALRAGGMTGDEIGDLRARATSTSTAIDHVHSWDRFALDRMQRDTDVAVTWQASVASLLSSCADRFRELRRLGDSSDLRIIALRA